MQSIFQSLNWFWTTGRFDPAWVQAVAAIALLVLAFVIFLVLCRFAWNSGTLASASRRSAEAAENASHAAISHVRTVVEKERARIFVFPASDEPWQVNLRQPAAIGAYRFRILNVGPTPAINVAVLYKAVATESATEANEKEYSRASFDQVLAGNKEMIAPLFINSALVPAPGVIANFYIHVWGEVTYHDVINPELRSTRFSFRVDMKSIKGDGTAIQSGEWVQFGTPEENSAT